MRELGNRVLLLAKHHGDVVLTEKLLSREGIPVATCRDLDELADEMQRGAACAIVAIEALGASRERLAATIAAQPAWSDLPIIVLTAGPVHAATAFDWLGKVSLLDRPLTVLTLLTTVRAALRARSRQYEARTAIEQRDQFLAMLGHELRNPLAAIVLASDPDTGADTPERLTARLATVSRQATHLARLVDDLLDVARVTSGKIVLQRERIDAVEVLAMCARSLAALAQARGVTVSVDAGAPVDVLADPLRVAQIVDNLVTNAIKYTPAGGRVDARAVIENGACAIHVRDTGIGIGAEMLPRIFDLFAQAESSLARSNGGMGIGLTLVKRLVELHGGTVEVASEGAGRGTEFTVRLPLAPAAAATDAASSGRWAAAGGAGLRAVIVDDNPDIRELSAEVLERLGCEVTTADDGPGGVDAIVAARPDVALVDIGLPGISGFEVAARVRAQLGSAPFLVAITGYGQAEDRERALAAGFDRHVAKPLGIATFRELVAAARK